MSEVRKLTENEVRELRECKCKPNGDKLFWDKIAEFYKNDPKVLKRIEFEKQYLLSVEAIPYEFASHWKTEKEYLKTVDDFYEMVGYTQLKENAKDFEDCLLEEIAAKFGIDIDINGDGMTSFEKYRNKK